MATCINPSVADEGMFIFSEHVRAGLDFFEASKLTVKALNKRGHLIAKEDFDIIARTRYNEVIPNGDYYTYVNQKIGKLKKTFLKELGVTGKFLTTGKVRKAHNVGPQAAEQLNRIANVIVKQDRGDLYDNLLPFERVIVDLYREGEYEPRLLEEAITYVREIREDGKTDLEARMNKQAAEIDAKASKMESSLHRVSEQLQELNKLATDALTDPDADLGELKAAAANAGIEIPPHLTTADEIAGRIVDAIEKKNRHWAAGTIFEGAVRFFGDYMVKVFDDMSYTLGRLDKRSAATTDGGVLESEVDNEVRNGKNRILKAKQEMIIQLGKTIAKHTGIKIPNFDSTWNNLTAANRAVVEYNFYSQVLQEQAIASGLEIQTGIRYKAGSKKGKQIVLTKGDIMQLYVDVLNSDVEKSMEVAGLSRNQLEVLANKHLTDTDKKIAMSMASEFYQDMWNAENEVYKEIYHTNMARLQNYGGPINYDGDIEGQMPMDVNMMNNRQTTQMALNNSIERQKTARPLNLNRNIYANAVGRLENSAKFRGAAKSYNEIAQTMNKESIKDLMGGGRNSSKVHLYNYHAGIMRKVNAQFGLENKVGTMPGLVAFLKGNFTHTALAFKPKLMLNQAMSATNWLIEDSFWDGISYAKDFTLPAEFDSLADMLYDRVPALKERYAKNDALIALDGNIQQHAHAAGIILESKSKLSKGWDSMKRINMWFTLKGDSMGIMAAGKYYFLGEYKKALDSGLSHEAATERAINMFSKKFEKTQQSYNTIDRAAIQNDHWGGMFTMFQTTPLQYGRYSLDAIRQVFRGADSRKGTLGYNVAKFMQYHVVSSLLYYGVMNILPAALLGELDEDDFENWALAGLMGPYLTAIFGLGTLANNIFNWASDKPFWKDFDDSAAFTTLNKIQKNIFQIVKLSTKSHLSGDDMAKLDRLKWNTLMETLQMFGIATKSYGMHINNQGDYEFESIIDNDDLLAQILRIAGYSDYSIRDAQGETDKPKSTRGRDRGRNSRGRNRKR